jgi:hypothetical protein
VIQESARTTVSQKNTVPRMTGHFNRVLFDFHSGSVRQVASSSSGYKRITVSEFRDLGEILAIGEKIIAPLPIAAAPGNIA